MEQAEDVPAPWLNPSEGERIGAQTRLEARAVIDLIVRGKPCSTKYFGPEADFSSWFPIWPVRLELRLEPLQKELAKPSAEA